MSRIFRATGRAAVAVLLATLPARAGAGAPSRAEEIVGDRVLSVPVPEGLGAVPAPRGLLLRPPEDRRSPYDVTVTIEPAAAPPAALPRLRRDGGTLARYRLDREEGGSGGAEVTLTAERPCDGAALRLVLRAQAEIPSTAMLEPAWAVLRGAECRRRDGPR
ncbi:MAG: Tsi3 family protein [Roseomonas mucosa]|nr:Tsi3 family protein [Roseomonas mucosa]